MKPPSPTNNREEEYNKTLNNISFGDGSNAINSEQNVDCYHCSGTFSVVDDNKEFVHRLGRVPIGFIVISKDMAADIYNGTTAWTDSKIYLRSTTLATIKFIVF